MKRVIYTLLFIFAIFSSAFAAPIGEQKAREIALNFFAENTTRASSPVLEMEWAGSNLATINNATRTSVPSGEESLIYIYNRLDTKGFVVVAGDDKVAKPIVAFSLDNNFDSRDMPDGAKAILDGWCKQIAATREDNSIQPATSSSRSSFGKELYSYETAVWGQGAPFNGLSPTHNGQKTPCGCVATAAGIICKYWEWPHKGEGTTPEYTYYGDNGLQYTGVANKLGHPYDWSLIKSDYRQAYTKAEGEMVAQLLYDLGCAFKMAFGVDGSGANTKNATGAMMTYFGYSKSAIFLFHSGRSEEEWNTMLRENLADGPVFFSGKSDEGGHAFVLCGCTDADYFRINYGWNGNSNGWYLLPYIQYYKNQGAAFHLVPDYDGTSTYKDYLTLAGGKSNNITYRGIYTKETEYSVEHQFELVYRIYNQGFGAFSGSYCVAHCDKDGDIKEIVWEYSRSSSPLKSGYSHTGTRKVTIKKAVEVGDRLRAFLKSPGSDKWERVVRDGDASDVQDEVILSATPTEVAQSLQLSYNKESKTMTFTSEQAIQYSVTNESGSVVSSGKVASFTPTDINLSDFKAGKYIFSFASGGEPYKVSVIL